MRATEILAQARELPLEERREIAEALLNELEQEESPEFIAELDTSRRAYLLNRIGDASQSILTTTEPDIFTKPFLEKAAVWKVHAGQIDTHTQHHPG